MRPNSTAFRPMMMSRKMAMTPIASMARLRMKENSGQAGFKGRDR
jgi:hypothetical protein